MESVRARYGYSKALPLDVLKEVIPESYSVVVMPKPGRGDPDKAIRKAINLKFRHKD